MSQPDADPSPPPLAALHAGDPQAWREAFALLWGAVQRAARRQLADTGEAEEVAAQALQETRLAVGTTKSWSEVGALAVVIARRRAISRGRALGALKRHPESVVSLDREEAADVGEAPQYAALRALDVQAVLTTLPPAQRELLQDYFLAGLTSEEVAQKRGVPAVTVRSQVMRLLAQLRERQQIRRNGPSAVCDSPSGTTS